MNSKNREPATSGTVRIRDATTSDAVDIADVHTRAILAIDRRFYNDSEITAWSWRLNPKREQRFSESLKESVFLVAEEEGQILGFAQLVPAEREVRAVYVLPEAGGRGIGGALLDRIEITALEMGIQAVEL